MWKIEAPSHSVDVVFSQCISRTLASTRAKLVAAQPSAVSASTKYQLAAASGTIHKLRAQDFESPLIESSELRNTYTNRMAAKKGPGRAVYDELKSQCTICPLCGHRPVFGLDHILPKTHFPLLSVTPTNLIPCCADCNHAKSEEVPSKPEDVYLNPYYESIDQDLWLVAEIIEMRPASAVFSVCPPDHWTAALAGRVNHHFDSLGLGPLYTAQAGVEIPALERVMERGFERSGIEGVREGLMDHRDGRMLLRQNSWQAALFQALLISDWYCGGGFRS